MVDCAELKIGLSRVRPESYLVELHFSDPESDAEIPPERGECGLDLEELLAVQQDPPAYGAALTRQLFAEGAVRAMWDRVKTAVESTDRHLRVRLLVGPSAPELHALRWELLNDPGSGAPLATSEKVLFSRFLYSRDWRPVRLRRKAGLEALVAVAAPTDVADYGLAEVDRDGEIARARASLGRIDPAVAGGAEPLTLPALVSALREGPDVVYLVCHGVLGRSPMPYVFLQDEEGKAARVSGEDLALRFSEMLRPPRLVVLASCESAGTGDAGAGAEGPDILASLAPRLAEAGVPAVVAMQGKISMETVERAMPLFFAELLEDGRVDRAMAVARGAVRERPDSWMPAVFSRLRGGRIWYEPRYGSGEDEAVKWRALANDIDRGRITPILGWGLAEGIYGEVQDLAHALARRHGFPLAPHKLTDLASVAQYLLVDQRSSEYVLDEVKREMARAVLARHGEALGPREEGASLARLLRRAGELAREQEEDPYRILAGLPAKVYVNASPDNLLEEALKARGREPEPVYAFWRRRSEPAPAYDREPTVDRPLVYHVLGYLGKEESMVLTEDDYFDFAIGVSARRALVPPVVRHALANTALIFLGFRLTDWNFRVLFRLILSQEGGQRRNRFSHTGVQVDPEGGQLIDVEQARRYLADYYDSENISIFWGSGADFLSELRRRLPDDLLAPKDEDEF